MRQAAPCAGRLPFAVAMRIGPAPEEKRCDQSGENRSAEIPAQRTGGSVGIGPFAERAGAAAVDETAEVFVFAPGGFEVKDEVFDGESKVIE